MLLLGYIVQEYIHHLKMWFPETPSASVYYPKRKLWRIKIDCWLSGLGVLSTTGSCPVRAQSFSKKEQRTICWYYWNQEGRLTKIIYDNRSGQKCAEYFEFNDLGYLALETSSIDDTQTAAYSYEYYLSNDGTYKVSRIKL